MTAWSDDFTSPTLHERWQLLAGDYTPPGLTDAAVLGPQISDNCVISLTADPVGDVVRVVALDDSFSTAAMMEVSTGGFVALEVGNFYDYAPFTGTPSLRRQDGVWTVLEDGQLVMGDYGPLSAPDEGGDLDLALEALDSTITQVSYTTLAETVAPSLSWGGDIQSLWWDGPVDAVYMGATLVWEAVVRVTPVAPTFLTASPWITLPTVEGVTYSVSGTPGVGQSVTVTATAQAGYELVGESVWQHTFPLPVVTIISTDELGFEAQDQLKQACIDHGTTFDTVEVLPFLLDTSQSTSLRFMFDGCSSLTQVPEMDTSQVKTMYSMFRGCRALAYVGDLATSQVTNMNNLFRTCAALTDGNVRLIGKHPSVTTGSMISGSGLTRQPFFDTNGNPI